MKVRHLINNQKYVSLIHIFSDLDEQVARDPSFLDRYLDKPQKPHTRVQKPHTRVYSSHSSVSISTIRRPDGVSLGYSSVIIIKLTVLYRALNKEKQLKIPMGMKR